MIRKVTQEGFDLTQKGIQQISEEISTILADAQVDSKDILQMRLLSEETLLKYKDNFEENTEVSIRFLNSSEASN